ncbi:chorismate synthase [Listeria booriae]|uniref:Chorismate synthase n=1 Tax=Listeria booriae TaxID=1552123 RepID=A0A841YKK6_9LIST|nr:chorismate synthase [Listeria booriae]MBC1400931.1 chorismate synthase [Listeria booriae]MBC1617244.1 chorismate synthase [Listeria booriae]MBC1918503.1 chorismate synthase [Listeria booriae]MBC2020908.1 chorismate synthase [Listeria booriae]MBC2067867.1 chorismate synthase [Listeria booriae]
MARFGIGDLTIDIGSSELEKKRDDYDRLHDRLKDAITEHDKLIREARSSLSSYKSAHPDFDNNVIPSKHFDSKREELTTKLEGYINDASDKRSRLTAARDKAYERYVHYRDAAAKEG